MNATFRSFVANLYTSYIVSDANNLYVADSLNHVIRAINLNTMIVTTIAGKPETAGFSGDGGLATNALLNRPITLAIDTVNKKLYISELDNLRIRVLDLASNFITTLLQFTSPIYFMTVHPTTLDLYYIDYQNVRVLNRTNYAITTFFYSQTLSPSSIVFTQGATYLTIISTNFVYLFNGTNLNPIAGNGLTGFGGDGNSATSVTVRLQNVMSIAVDNANKLLYLCDSNNQRIRLVNLQTNIITTLAGTGARGYSGDGL